MNFDEYMASRKKKGVSEAKKPKVYSSADIKRIVEDAEDAFWGTVSDLVPEAESIDMDPGAQKELVKAMEKAVKVWIGYNTYSNK